MAQFFAFSTSIMNLSTLGGTFFVRPKEDFVEWGEEEEEEENAIHRAGTKGGRHLPAERPIQFKCPRHKQPAHLADKGAEKETRIGLRT